MCSTELKGTTMDKMHCADKGEALSEGERIRLGGVDMVKSIEDIKVEKVTAAPTAPEGPIGFDINNFIDKSSPNEMKRKVREVPVNRTVPALEGGWPGFSGNQLASLYQGGMAGNYQNNARPNSTAHAMEGQQRSERRCLASCSIQVAQNGLYLFRYYDDWTVDPRLILGLVGPVKIGGVRIEGSDQPIENIFLSFLSYENGNCYIFLPKNKKRNVSLREVCERQGIHFDPFVSGDEIERGLRGFLSSLDECVLNENILTIPALAGWFDGKLHDRLHPACSIVQADLPITKRTFSRVSPTPQGLETYIRELRMMFPDPAERMLLASWPIAGLLSSLLRKHGVPIKAVLNLIPTGDVNQEAIAGMLQVFSRSRLAIFDAGKSQKQLDGILDKSRDEVLIFDCRYQSNQYQRNLRKQTADRLLRMVGENEKTGSGRNADFAVVLLSDQYQPGAFNVLLPEMNECFSSGVSRLGESQGLEMVLSGVVNKIEGRFEEAEQIFCRRWNCPDFRLMPISIAIDFLRDFFRSVGRDLDKELALPEISDLAALIEDNGDSEDERRDLFIRVIRSHASRWMCEEKHYRQEYHEGTLYYDENYLYCPVDMFKKLFAEVHRAALLPRVLVELRNRGDLITDGPNLMGKKVMIGNERKDYYVFPISLFNRKGLPGILDLARRPEGD